MRKPASRGRASAGRHARKRRPAATLITVAAVFVVSVGATGAMWVARHGYHGPGAGQARSDARPAARLGARLPARSQHASADRAARLAALDRQLDAELAALLGRHAGDLAVGVVDRSTGAVVMYHSGERFYAASIVKADILAALLLRDQRSGEAARLPGAESGLAQLMMAGSSNDAATDLWAAAGGAAGIAGANARLGLRHTVPDQAGAWGLTATTVADQLRLLADLTLATSPLSAASRSYQLSLMRQADPAEHWGVSAAAAPGSAPAVRDGWLLYPALWIVNSIGVVRHAGQLLCLAVLSDGQPSAAAGISQVSSAARAAVDLITAGGRPAQLSQPAARPGQRSGRPGAAAALPGR